MPETDPDGPDVLTQGPDREPWRPSKAVVAATTVGLVLATGAAAARAWTSHERRLDRRVAAQALIFVASLAEAGTPNEYAFDVVNDGAHAVRIVETRLVGPGYPAQTQDVLVRPHGSAPIVVPPGTGCDPDLYLHPPLALLLRARTVRGTSVTRTITLVGDIAQEVEQRERERCGFQRPLDAMNILPGASTTHGLSVFTTLRVSNRSRLPLTLVDLDPFPGLVVRGPLPLTIPAADPARGGDGQATLQLTIRVTDCRSFTTTWFTLVVSGSGDILHGHVRNRFETATARVPLQDSGPGDGPEGPSPLRRLGQLCPQTRDTL